MFAILMQLPPSVTTEPDDQMCDQQKRSITKTFVIDARNGHILELGIFEEDQLIDNHQSYK